jgi:low temperature requirement protein LtrA
MTDDTPAEERIGVSTLELFFDLVFVFTITQLTGVLADQPSWTGLLQVMLMLAIIFWMYGGYVWLTNSVSVDRLTRRLTLLGGMASFFLVALAIPAAFSGNGATFGLAYMVVVLLHLGMFARSSRASTVRAILGLAPFNLSTAALVLAGGLIGGTAQYVIWTIAAIGEWASAKLIDDSGFVIEPGHFVERHGLVVLIAIGESVIAVGIGAAGLTVDARLVLVALLGLALSGCLWWTHFGTDEGAAERAMANAPVVARPRLAINAFGYWHMVILLGIIAIAAALRTATGHALDPLTEALAVALGGGAAVFLVGEALFRWTLGIGAVASRSLAAAVALLTIPIGVQVEATAQLAVLVGVFVAMLAFEGTRTATLD